MADGSWRGNLTPSTGIDWTTWLVQLDGSGWFMTVNTGVNWSPGVNNIDGVDMGVTVCRGS